MIRKTMPENHSKTELIAAMIGVAVVALAIITYLIFTRPARVEAYGRHHHYNKPTETPTPTVNPCDGELLEVSQDVLCVTPTVTPEVTPSATPTPTEVIPTETPVPTTPPSPHGDGLSDGKSDGKSSCPECTQAPQPTLIPQVGWK